VIFITGGAFTQRAREFVGRCPQPVLEKPFDPTRLASLVTDVVRGDIGASAAPGSG
jgi:hypothetical protein